MERKRRKAIDDYIDSITCSAEERSQRMAFYENLRHFYRKKWQCPLKPPYIHGVEVDLYDLFEKVRSLGGWQKVTSLEKWMEVVKKMKIDENTQNADHALKLIYTRYLGKFEQTQFGNDNDNDESDLMGGRLRKVLGYGTYSSTPSEAPVSVPKSSSNVKDSLPSYDKLEHSLMSGLPNEVDFALNVITLLSHPGPYVMRFDVCPNLITLLIAHCCPIHFFDGRFVADDTHKALRLLQASWEEQLGYKIEDFWRNANITDMDLAKISGVPFQVEDKECAQLFEDNRFPIENAINWRVYNTLAIFRNLSFEECNKAPMAENIHLLRFLLLCINCRWQSLINNAFDILSNIASEIDLTGTSAIFQEHLLLKSLADGLVSNDQFVFLRSAETLGRLANVKSNEVFIYDFLCGQVLNRIIDMLAHKNILCCVTLLESLLEVSHLGRRVCDLISDCGPSIRIFIKLLTVDAASILNGTKEQNRIKIVQVHGPTGQEQPYVSARRTVPMVPAAPQNQAQFSSAAGANRPIANPPPMEPTFQLSQPPQHHQHQSHYVVNSRSEVNSPAPSGTGPAAHFAPPTHTTVEYHQQKGTVVEGMMSPPPLPHETFVVRQQPQNGGGNMPPPASVPTSKLVERLKAQQKAESSMEMEDDSDQFMCEWECCGCFFSTVEGLLQHNTLIHLLNKAPPKKPRGRTPLNKEKAAQRKKKAEQNQPPISVFPEQTFVCKWPLCTDALPRALWSMVTHLQESHCNESYLQMAAQKRMEMGSVHYLAYLNQLMLKQREPPMIPGYSKFAAIEAIRRNASVNIAKEFSDDSEGPVTRSIRLTTSLILRNIAKYSPVGRNKLKMYESQLSNIAFSRMEAGTVIAQCLREMAKAETHQVLHHFHHIPAPSSDEKHKSQEQKCSDPVEEKQQLPEESSVSQKGEGGEVVPPESSSSNST